MPRMWESEKKLKTKINQTETYFNQRLWNISWTFGIIHTQKKNVKYLKYGFNKEYQINFKGLWAKY